MARTSTSLLERLRLSPDSAAWERFVEIYGPMIYRWLRQFDVRDQDAGDLSQEVLLTVVREMPSFQYDPQHGFFRGWLRGVVVNRLRGFWRSQRTKPADWNVLDGKLEQLADPASEATRHWNDEYDNSVVVRVLRLLKTEFELVTWQAFWRVVVDGDKPAMVATGLGISVNAVYLAKSHVLRRLRQECNGLLEEPTEMLR